MPFAPGNRLPHEVPTWVKAGSLYFFTRCVHDRERCNPTSEAIAPKLISAARFYHEQGTWYARILLIMPDHLHALIAFPNTAEIRATWRTWKRYTSRDGTVSWQRDHFGHRLRSDESLEEKACYFRENPLRKGLTADARLWPWVFEGMRQELK